MQENQSMLKYLLVAFCILSSISLHAIGKKQPKEKESSKVYIVEEKTGISAYNNKTLTSLYNEAVEWLKTPYRRGGMSHRGMDCSGLTNTIFKNVFGIQLQRRSRDIYNKDVVAVKKDDLQPGDLVFFATSRRGKGVNHVGVYLGNHKFVHASVSNGVIISDLNEGYYARTWVKGGRIKNTNETFESLFAKQQENPNIKDISIEPFLFMNIEPNHSIKEISLM
ncbi:MAG: C40 family peptidase [Dysgonomonas sp.]|nr:C40 family peptidase [Dysgonomonas sp.]